MDQIKLTKDQELRLAIASTVNFDVEKAKPLYDFVTAAPLVVSANDSTNRPDGIYYIISADYAVHESNVSADEKKRCIAIGYKLGDRFANVALHYCNDGEEVALVKDDESSSHLDTKYYERECDALYDFDGVTNTGHLKQRLNPAINLKTGEYIPSLGELNLICHKMDEINQALKSVGGDPLVKEVHWSSTEYNGYYSWYVYFYYGSSTNGYNEYGTFVVRPAVAYRI